MFRSLRFRLPAFSLAGIALAGLVTTAIALQLYQRYTHNQSLHDLRREAKGLTRLYTEAANRAYGEGHSAPDYAVPQLEAATGDRIFYVGTSIFPGLKSGLKELPYSTIDWKALKSDEDVTFEFRPPGEKRTFIAPERVRPS